MSVNWTSTIAVVESRNVLREINFPFYNGALTSFSFPLRANTERANHSDRRRPLSFLSWKVQGFGERFALVAVFLLDSKTFERCEGILRERRLMLELLRIIGTIHKEKTIFTLFARVFFAFFYFLSHFFPFRLLTLISVIFKRFAGERFEVNVSAVLRSVHELSFIRKLY